MPPFQNDEERFEALKDAIADTYATGPRGGRRRKRPPRAKTVVWFALGGCLVLLVFAAVMIGEWRSAQPVSESEQANDPASVAEATGVPVTLPPYTPAPHKAQTRTPPPTAAPTTSPTATPSPQATATTSPAPSSRPTATASPSPAAPAAAVIHNASLLVKSNKVLRVGARGSCGGLDVTVEVRGYPKGCTVFDADSTGPLANGRGAVLVVPVSTTEDVGDVKYGLLYYRSNAADAPHFVGLLQSHGSGRVVVKLEHGRIMEQTGDEVAYYTFNGHRIVRIGD